MSASLVIEKGKILIYRVFDVAEEIDLPLAERLLSEKSNRFRVHITPNKIQAIIIRNPPIRVTLGPTQLTVAGVKYEAEVVATIWDYGVVSISFQIIIDGMIWSDLLKVGADVSNNTKAFDEIYNVGLQKSKELTDLIQTALKAPSGFQIFEDYTIYFLQQVQGVKNNLDLTEKLDLPALIQGEIQEELSPKNREGMLQHLYQYSKNDSVIIDWNSAVIYEPKGDREIIDVIEFALTHLLEFRYYDDLLDRRLAELYASIEVGRQRIWRSQFATITTEANAKFIEFSEFVERVDNSLKVVGDFYLATVFRGALRRFRVLDWQESITRKMNILARVSELLQGELNARRSQLLEIIIILLIAFEIVSAMIKTTGT